jgi:ParB family chromosome partitioning protein
MEDKISRLPLEKLHPFENHPYKVLDDDKMIETVESIKNNGVLIPIIVRPRDVGGYEIISGHRRHHASKLAGFKDIPAIVKDLEDDIATILLVDSNIQRENLLPSEKAHAYKMKMEAIKRQGKRTDLTLRQIGEKLNSADILGKSTGESARQIQRFIRLTELKPTLMDMVDNKTIAFNAAVSADTRCVERAEVWCPKVAESDVPKLRAPLL